jgi:hypothetical protein
MVKSLKNTPLIDVTNANSSGAKMLSDGRKVKAEKN